jgi:hypothetical protein
MIRIAFIRGGFIRRGGGGVDGWRGRLRRPPSPVSHTPPLIAQNAGNASAPSHPYGSPTSVGAGEERAGGGDACVARRRPLATRFCSSPRTRATQASPPPAHSSPAPTDMCCITTSVYVWIDGRRLQYRSDFSYAPRTRARTAWTMAWALMPASSMSCSGVPEPGMDCTASLTTRGKGPSRVVKASRTASPRPPSGQ